MTISPKTGIGSTGLSDGDGIGGSGLLRPPAGPTLLVFDSFTNNTGSDVLLVNHDPDTTLLGRWQETGTNEADVLTADILSVLAATNSDVCFFDVASHLPAIMEAKYVTDIQSFTRWLDIDDLIYIYVQNTRIRLFENTGGSLVLRGDTGTGLSFSTFWMADTGSEITVGVNRGAPLISYSTTAKNSSADFGVIKSTNDRRTDNFQLVGGTTDPADLQDLP